MVSRMKTEISDKSIRYEGDKTVFIDYSDPENIYSYYRWDEKGRAIEKAGLCCGIQSTLVYDEDNNVIKRIDANGNSTTYTYDERGNMLSLTDPNGFIERYTYDADFNQVSSFTDKNGNSYSYSYDGNGNLLEINGPIGFRNTYTYDKHGWITKTIDANGNTMFTFYNPDGTTQKVLDAAGYTTSYTYDICGNIISKTDGRGNTTTFFYDQNNRNTSVIDALGNTTSYSYDNLGNIVRKKNAKKQIYTYSYDALGNILKRVDPQGGIYKYTYDGRGNIIMVKDPIGNLQTIKWNENNRMIAYTNGEDETTSYDYDANGNLVKIFHPNGNVETYEYDSLDRIVQLSDNMGILVRYTYDNNGNILTETDGLERTKSYVYDELNRRIEEMLPSGVSAKYTYDSNSNLIIFTDPKGNSTYYTYSSLNKILSHTDALNAMTKYEFDGNGNLVKILDAKGNPTTYTYDALDHITAITFANGLSLQYTYDELGRIIASKDRAGHGFKYTYDKLGNFITKTYPDGTYDSFTYDGKSRLLSAINKNATVSFSYDRAGRILSESLNGKVTSYSYDVASGRRFLTYPSGMKVVERRNARNLIHSILQNGREVAMMEYNVSGQKNKQLFANGITTKYGYNENGWLRSIKSDQDIIAFVMDYDFIGNINHRQDLLNINLSESYDYDDIGQLTSFKRGTIVDKTYQFDILGNRVKVIENGITTNYKSNNVNAYTHITGGLNLTPQYDENGSLTNDGNHTYVYDFNNKLISVDNDVVTYKYDALGRRIAQNSTLFFYAGDQMVEEIIEGVSTSYLYGNRIDEVLQMKRGEDEYYYHSNHLGSIVALSNSDGMLVERVDYDVYGKPIFKNAIGNIQEKSSINNTILFSGREYDEKIGIYYYRSRFLHPDLGRFMQKDLYTYIDGMNDYSYVTNRVISYFDPFGTKTVPGPNMVAKGAGGLLIGVGIVALAPVEIPVVAGAAIVFGAAGIGAIWGTLEDEGRPTPRNPFDGLGNQDYQLSDDDIHQLMESCCKRNGYTSGSAFNSCMSGQNCCTPYGVMQSYYRHKY